MANPVFSVILPTFNRAYVLWRAIQSVIQQTESDWELIVVDDGSTDCTLRLLEEFQDSRIRVLSIANGGPSAARNVGISQADGEFIAYLDSDNTWVPHFLSTFLRHVRASPSNVLWYCGQHSLFWERSGDGTWLLECEAIEPREQYSQQDILGLAGADTSAMVHRHSVVGDAVKWDEQCRWLEDWDFFLQVSLAFPGRLQWVPEILLEYRQVHGADADGMCSKARENPHIECEGRRYLLDKWADRLTTTGLVKLDRSKSALKPIRARTSKTS